MLHIEVPPRSVRRQGKFPCFTQNSLFPVKNGEKEVNGKLTPTVTSPKIAQLIEVLREDVTVAVGQAVTIDDMLQSSNRVVEFAPFARALELAKLFAHLAKSSAIASVPAGVRLRAFDIGSHAPE
jgi:hypothetical protein